MNRIPTTAWRARGKTLALALVLAASLAVFVAAGRAQAVPVVFVVNATGDGADADTADGVCQTATADECTLRAAIQQANVNASSTEVDTINFAVPAADPNCAATTGVCTISPTSELPEITQAVIIDGYTQPGASPNTLATGNNAQLKIELSGASAETEARGIRIRASDSVVRGLIVNRWYVAVELTGDSVIEGNYIGTDASGTQDLGNVGGVRIFASNNVVGGTSAAARNVISGNDIVGVQVDGSGNRIEGNHIGTDASGNGALGNRKGVIILASNNVVGGTSAAARNVISGNDYEGIFIIGGFYESGNRILRNSVFDNGGLGIDLDDAEFDSDHVTPNDAGDADTGSNGLQNFPVITSATTSGGTTSVQGTLNSTPDDTFNLQFFSSAQADPSGFGEGESFVGQTNVTTNANGNTTFSFTTTSPVAGGRFVTATATNTVTDDTSEFSRAVEVEDNTPPPPPPPQCSDDADNDADGRTDFPNDAGCSSASDNSENSDPPPPAPRCSDGQDNDADGQTDFPADTNCSSATDDSEAPDPPAGCTIVGTPGDDDLIGTSGGDTICGLGGEDTISADSGNDTVRGGGGNDTIQGRSGSDTLQGGGGADTVRGGAGDDDLSGEAGPDGLSGEAGDDALDARDGVRGNDASNGGSGIDTCSSDDRDEEERCET